MKIAIVTDAWHPQINGVVTTLDRTARCLESLGHTVCIVSADRFKTVPCPTYPEIRLALWPGRRLACTLDQFEPDAIHIATEGPLGNAARRYCRRSHHAFTTSYHTRFPQYVRARIPIPERWTYRWLKRHHADASRILVPTDTVRRELEAQGYRNLAIWSRGVDTALFRPRGRGHAAGAGPIQICVGRVAVEKNVEAFLATTVPGTKIVVGSGPDLERLRRKFPDVQFVGYRFGVELAQLLSSADVFVFPSRTDTFGLVMLEAMACGTPVAAFRTAGPVDVIRDGIDGVLDDNLDRAIRGALTLDRAACRRSAEARGWSPATAQFLAQLVPVRGAPAR